MTSWIRRGAIAIAACSALVLGACGDDDDDRPAAPTRTVKLASLDGAQETPAVATTAARGSGVLEVNETTGAVSGFVVTTGLTGVTAAHVHQAARGTPGAVIVPLTGGPDLWVVPDGAPVLTAEQIAAFRDGNLYFNVHTGANPNGEIRGQIDKTGAVRLASLDGAQEAPPVTAATARGAGLLAVDDASGAVAGFVVSSGLVGVTNAHVHQAARGTPGGVIVPLAGGPNLWVVPDAATLTADQRAAFRAGSLYYNVHTVANPNGEIRGQLDKSGTLRFAALDGAQETPAVATGAFGAGVLAVDEASGAANGFVVASGLPTANAAHVHAAARGAPGGVVVPMSGGANFWVIPDAGGTVAASALTAGGLYYNVHTPANPTGEIRGQLE